MRGLLAERLRMLIAVSGRSSSGSVGALMTGVRGELKVLSSYLGGGEESIDQGCTANICGVPRRQLKHCSCQRFIISRTERPVTQEVAQLAETPYIAPHKWHVQSGGLRGNKPEALLA